MHTFIRLTLAASLTAAPMAVDATPPPVPITVRVPYGDLDIALPQDAATLKRRIARAVARACRAPSSYSGSSAVMDEKCRTDALQAALAVMESRRAVQVAARN